MLDSNAILFLLSILSIVCIAVIIIKFDDKEFRVNNEKNLAMVIFATLIFWMLNSFYSNPVVQFLTALDIPNNTISDATELLNASFVSEIPSNNSLHLLIAAVIIILIIGALLYFFDYIRSKGVWIFIPDSKEYRYLAALLLMPSIFFIFVIPALLTYFFSPNVSRPHTYIELIFIILAVVILYFERKLGGGLNYIQKRNQCIEKLNDVSFIKGKNNNKDINIINFLQESLLLILPTKESKTRFLKIFYYVRKHQDIAPSLIITAIFFSVLIGVACKFNLLSIIFILLSLLFLYIAITTIIILPDKKIKIYLQKDILKNEIDQNNSEMPSDVITGYAYGNIIAGYDVILIKDKLITLDRTKVVKYEEATT
jgi:hypothetical protein